ncbi:alpha/beta fold hydrolase [Bacillus mangrovi]|uniref:Alpha/beta fold hydrolase n=2 Tax=Metabacillus mangrovi TaxID=1491830 RepID=A0A7X2V3P0_9BACI|nr:alpha/beta fold hydrolase [Metabacillus mangrovi]
MMMYIKKRTDEEILERETLDGHFIQKDFDELEKLEVTIPSEYGYDVKGYLVAPYENRKFVIICHGVTVNRYNSVKYMNLFLNRGFNVLIYDHRRHGESGGKTTSYGHYEKYDLRSAVHWLKEKYGQDITLGIHGESMGSVTMLLYAGMLEDGADFYVADCPFHSLEDQLLYRLKVDYRLPGFFVMPVARPFLKWRDGYSLRDVSPIAVVDQIKKPLLFIHSKKDAYIPADSSRQLFEKKTGPKKIYFAENGDHAMSFTENRAEYERVLDEFLEEIGLAEKQEAYKEKR